MSDPLPNPVPDFRQGLLARIRAASKCPARPDIHDMLWSALGSFLGIGAVSFLAFHYSLPLLVASFGATAVLIYGAPTSPFAQPRNVLGGHLVSAFIGVVAYQLLGTTWLSVTLGVSLAILLMLFTRTVHPPGGATALTAILNGQGFAFISEPVLLGVLILLLVALVVHRCRGGRYYPTYWF